ncbi:hypothetical protein Leryth_025569, partial [Lithospermum erythrorhizon]
SHPIHLAILKNNGFFRKFTQYEQYIKCYCGLIFYPITSWKQDGRRFIKWPNRANGFGMWQWKNPEVRLREKAIIMGLFKKCNKIEDENSRLARKVKILWTIIIIRCICYVNVVSLRFQCRSLMTI